MDILKFEAELEVLRATNSKLIHETAKLQNENRWMPFIWGATFASAVFGIVITLIKVLH
ncbi:hypothetical protein [Paraburkholderia graminis]